MHFCLAPKPRPRLGGASHPTGCAFLCLALELTINRTQRHKLAPKPRPRHGGASHPQVKENSKNI